MRRFHIVLFLAFLFAIPVTGISTDIPKNLAPSTYFKNTFREILSPTGEDVDFFKETIAAAGGKVAFISYRYKPKKDNDYNLSLLNDSLVLDEDEQLKLAVKYLENNKAAPIFVVRKSEIPHLRRKLQLLYNDKNFVLLPCGDTYERWPLLEDQYSRYSDQYWSNTGALFNRLGVQKAVYLGDEASEVLFQKQLSGSLYDTNKSKMKYADILAMYGDLTPELTQAVLDSGSVHYLALRDELAPDVIRSIVKINDYYLFKSLLSNANIEPEVLVKILEEEMENVSPRTYESMLEFLLKDGKKDNMDLKKGLFNLICENIDELSARIEHTDINIFNAIWNIDTDTKESLFYSLYLSGFSDWHKIFKGETVIRHHQDVLLPLFKKHSFVAAAIIKELADYDVSYLLKLMEWLESEGNPRVQEALYKVLEINESLLGLKNLFEEINIPINVEFLILIRALKAKDADAYISAIKKYYEKGEVKEALANPKLTLDIHGGLNLWLAIVALNPSIDTFMQEEKENFPASIGGNVTMFVSDKRNYDFLEKYLLFLRGTLLPDSEFSSDDVPEVLLKTVNAALVIPSPDAISVFDDIFDVWKNARENHIFDLSSYENLSLPARYAVARTDDTKFAAMVNALYGFEEIKSHRGSRFKLSSVLLHPNTPVFKDVLINIFNAILNQLHSKNTRSSLIPICESLWLFMTLPESKEISMRLNDRLNEFFEKRALETEVDTISLGKNILSLLRTDFIKMLGSFWDMGIRKDLPIDIVYKRLSDVESFWTYYAQWKTLLNGKSGDKDVLAMIDMLKKSVQDYVNYGKNVKEIKYGGTPESAKQLEIMELLLNDIWADDENIEGIMERQKQDVHYRVKLKNGKALNCYAVDSLPFWLNRGYYGGGTCASPATSPGYTKCVNGVTFSALSRRVVVSPTPDGKEGIVSETKSITEINGKHVPVLLNEHLYIAPSLPEGVSKQDISEAATIAAFKNAALYGIPYLFFVEENTNMTEPTNFAAMGKYDGYSTEIEYIDVDGNIVRKAINVKKIKGEQRRTFYHLKENNRWKYSDNALYIVSSDGRMEKTYENMNTIDFDINSVKGQIAGEDCEYVANVLGGSLLSIETEVISVEKIDTVDRFAKMYPEYDAATMESKLESLKGRLDERQLVLVANENLQSERTKGKETTLSLIRSIEDSGVAADYYLSKVYKLSSEMGKVLFADLKDMLGDADTKKLMVGIPRAGIPIASRLKKVLKNKAVNISYELMDADRNIYNHKVVDNSVDAVFLCDQVINTGKTIGKNIELILEHNPDADIYILAPVTADPNAVMRLYRKYPQIKKIYAGDIRRRVEGKKGISSPVGHPGERSYPQNYEALFEKGKIVKVQERSLKILDVISDSYFKRTFKVRDVDSGELYRLKIMVSSEEGLQEESISALAAEEGDKNNTLVKGVKFYPQNAFLLSPYSKGETLSQVVAGNSAFKNYKLTLLLRDLKETVKFLKKYNRFSNGFSADSIIWDEDSLSWKVTGFFNSQMQGDTLDEKDLISSVFAVLDSVKDGSPAVYLYIMRMMSDLDAGIIFDLDSLILALEELDLDKSPETYVLSAA